MPVANAGGELGAVEVRQDALVMARSPQLVLRAVHLSQKMTRKPTLCGPCTSTPPESQFSMRYGGPLLGASLATYGLSTYLAYGQL